eukprot:GEMP01041797.1.p1 GENE.GEMP01041797.1~~GEMP01041797.1.p1  ORF type:complete len:360 (-),score=118.88 GEMP01041797.1:594-1673(-)
MTANRIDYSKWDHIECSDDECEDLPHTIDKKSFQRYTKNKRTERDTGERKEETSLTKRLEVVKDKLAQLGSVGRTHVAGQKLEKEKAGILAQLEKLRRNKHWNVDNMCHVVEDRTIVTDVLKNPPVDASDTKVTSTSSYNIPYEGKEMLEGYADFCETRAQVAEEFIAMAKEPLLSCEDFMIRNAESVLSEHAETYMMLDCLEKEMNGEHEAMVASARQQQLVTQVRTLAKTLNRPVQDAVKLVFERVGEVGGIEDSFQEQVETYVAMVVERAKVKKKEMEAERARESDGEEEEMDPEVQKVLDELPASMLEAFQKQDLRALHLAVSALPSEKGKYYMRRCAEVGLWSSGDGENAPSEE